MTPEKIAEFCHDALRVFDGVLGRPAAKEWKDLSSEDKKEQVNQVNVLMQGLGLSALRCHERWIDFKKTQELNSITTKNEKQKAQEEQKIHDTYAKLVPFEEFTESSQRAALLFKHMVESLINF